MNHASFTEGHDPTGSQHGSGDLYWDPFDKSLRVDPHPVWRRLRDEAPLYYNERHDFWALSRFADVDAAHRDPKTFSSAHGTVLELMTTDLIGSEGMMIFLDPPEHTRLRRLVSKAFTPGASGRWRRASAGCAASCWTPGVVRRHGTTSPSSARSCPRP